MSECLLLAPLLAYGVATLPATPGTTCPQQRSVSSAQRTEARIAAGFAAASENPGSMSSRATAVPAEIQ